MTTMDSDPCAQPRDALNKAEQELVAHREAYGESDEDQGAAWGAERRRLLDSVSAAIASYEECMRANESHLLVPPDLAADFSAMSRMRNREGPVADEPADE